MANPANTLPAPNAADRAATDMAAIVKDAALFALVTFGLCFPIVAFRTDLSQTSALDLVPRWGLVAILCGIVFVGRLAQRLILANRDARRALTPRRSRRRRRCTPSRTPRRGCRPTPCRPSSA